MLPQLSRFARLPFALSWWAYSFPLAALTIAQFVMAEREGAAFYRFVGFGLYGLLVLLIAALTIRTVVAVARGEICVPEH
jgi:tellurite resistance protein